MNLETHPTVQRVALATRIITVALFLGQALFLGLVVFLHSKGETVTLATPSGVISVVAVAMAAAMIGMRFFVPKLLAQTMLKRLASRPESRTRAAARDADLVGQLATIAQAEFIIARALVEGGGLFAIIAYYLERRPEAMAAGIVMMLLTLLPFPSPTSLSEQLSRTLEDLAAGRSAG